MLATNMRYLRLLGFAILAARSGHFQAFGTPDCSDLRGASWPISPGGWCSRTLNKRSFMLYGNVPFRVVIYRDKQCKGTVNEVMESIEPDVCVDMTGTQPWKSACIILTKEDRNCPGLESGPGILTYTQGNISTVHVA